MCGGAGVTTNFLIYLGAINASLRHQLANGIGYLAGALVGFFLNRTITFSMHDRAGQRLTLYVMVAGVGFAASALLLWGLVDLMAVEKRLAKGLTLPVVVALQFSLNRHITFRRHG